MLAASTAMLFTFVAIPQVVQAQSVYVLAGAAIPSSDYGDIAKTGWLAGAGFTYPVGGAGLWVGAEGLYSRSSADSESSDVSFKPFSLMGIVGYDIPTEGKVAPYVFGGLGYQSISQSTEGVDSLNGFGYQFGAGIGIQTSGNISPFIEGRYQGASLDVEGSDESFTLGFVGIEAGVSIGLGGNNDDM
jgi:opacity protein-like surface antigen